MKKKKEYELEKRCIMYARSNGWDCWKNENNGNTGIPDYSLLSPEGRFLLVEFKRPNGGGRVSQQQIIWKNKHPETVYICDNFENFTTILKKKK